MSRQGKAPATNAGKRQGLLERCGRSGKTADFDRVANTMIEAQSDFTGAAIK
jgi:hypothetical protein